MTVVVPMERVWSVEADRGRDAVIVLDVKRLSIGLWVDVEQQVRLTHGCHQEGT